MNADSLIKDLEDIVNSIDFSVIPYKKGNSIRIKKYVIRKSRTGYNIYDCEHNKLVTKTNFKHSAVAIVRSLIKGKNVVNSLEILDKKLLKHYNDAIFYKDTIKKSKDPFIKETREIRLSIAVEETNIIKQHLEEIIFD